MATFVTVKRKSGPDGCQTIIRRVGHRPLKRTFDTRTQARIWAGEQEALILAKRFKDPRLAEKVSLFEALEKFQEHGRVIEGKSASTLDREKYSKAQIERWFGSETTLAHINASMVSQYQRERIEDGASHSSIRQELSMLSKMFELARREWQLPVDNPVADITRVSPAQGRERFLSEREAELVISEAKKSRNEKFYPYALLLLHSGMRSGEAARVQPEMINFEKQTILIQNTKSGRPRTVPLTRLVSAALEEIEPYDSGYLFLKKNHLSSSGIMLRPGSVFRECWKRLWGRLEEHHHDNPDEFPEIPHFTVHDLRHTAGSHLLKHGVDIRIIADILGHSTLQMVLRYTHLDDDSRVEHIEKIGHLGGKTD